jgi:signal transduction histidine kinase/CheY-like chemotaxis protein
MGDRKSDRESSSPAGSASAIGSATSAGSASPAGSSSLRISSGGKSRPLDLTDSRIQTAEIGSSTTAAIRTTTRPDVGKPVDSSELLRSNAMLFLIASVFATVFAITELATGHFREIGASYLWLVAAAVLSWTAFFLRERGQHWLWVSLIGVASLNTLLITSDMPTSVVLAGVLVILMWSAMILRPRYNVILAAYAVLMMWRMGGEFVMTASQMDVEGPALAANQNDNGRRFALPVLFTFIAVPVGLGTILHLRQRSSPKSGVSDAERAILTAENDDLRRRLEGKSNELELASEQLFEAQKLKMVGTMAAGLAHELNNILTPIRGHAELIAEGEHKVEQIRRYGQRILDSAVAAATITQALLTYAHKGTFQPVRSNLRQLLQSTILPVLSKTLPNNVHIKTDLARNVSVDVDRHLFQQAITNLVYNAGDAMPEGGEIVIGLTTSTAPAGDRTDGGDEANGAEPVERSAVVTVADNGTGIEEEHLSQIFDPFFTTKAVGTGSGLGLAMVMGTVTRHHGRIEVDSVVGHGTTFRIYLQLAVSDEKNDGPKPWPVLRGDAKGPVVIVVTEDQDALDEFEELLETVECKPICTNDAKAAAPLLTEMGDKVDLLILDLELVETDGKRLFKTVRELFPEMPVILLSNQPIDPMVQRMMAAGPTRSVRKPMDNRLFSTLLTDLLNPADGYVRDFTPVPINPSADVSGPHPRAT